MKLHIPKEVQGKIDRLYAADFQVYLVGGAVRDYLCGIIPDDFDLVTDARPEQIATLFADCRVSINGATFKVTMVDDIEIATFRRDWYEGLSDKNVVITYAETLEEDLERRDLTFNAIAYNPRTRDIIDPHGGVHDLKHRILRFSGNPFDRIFEDPNRIIRAFRFCAKIDGDFDGATRKALHEARDYTGFIAPERIRIELLKAMELDRPSLFFRYMQEAGVLDLLIPELAVVAGIDGGRFHGEDVLTHSLQTGDLLPRHMPLLRLTGFLHDLGKAEYGIDAQKGIIFYGHEGTGARIAGDVLRRFKFSNDETACITALISEHMTPVQPDHSHRAIRKMLSRFAHKGIDFKDFMRLKLADSKANLARNSGKPLTEVKGFMLRVDEALSHETTAITVKELAVNGYDIMTHKNIKSGPQVGAILSNLLERVIDDPVFNTREALLKLADEMVDEDQGSGFGDGYKVEQ
jgi:tRNA nucleotidyltransferase/poly(A) polymerase